MSQRCLQRVLLAYAVPTALMVYSLAACSAPAQVGISSIDQRTTAGDAARPRMDASGCGKSVVYVTSYNNSVYIYDQKHTGSTPCGQITGLTNPQGLFVDSKRNLWVVVAGNCRTVFGSVLEFAPGSPTPVKTLQDPNGEATSVAVDDNDGTVYVTNFFGFTKGCASGNPGNIDVYADGSTTPTSTLTDSDMAYAFGDAVDDNGNLYVTYASTSNKGGIYEWTDGTGTPTDLGVSVTYPAGIQTTKSGALLVCDQATGCGDFQPGATRMSRKFGTAGDYAVALDKHEKRAWVEDPAASANQLLQYKYPGPDPQPKSSLSVPGGGYAGVALSPAAPQGKPY